MEPYLVLLRVEFTLLRTITSRTVRSYRTLSPLPIRRLAVSSLLHLSSVHTAQALPGTLLYEARTFLPALGARQLSGQLGADYSLRDRKHQQNKPKWMKCDSHFFL